MKAKRLVALLVAIMLVVGLLAIPAAAAQMCVLCGRNTATVLNSGTYTRYTRVDSCGNYGSVHSHLVSNDYTNYSCTNCGRYEINGPNSSSCPYA